MQKQWFKTIGDINCFIALSLLLSFFSGVGLYLYLLICGVYAFIGWIPFVLGVYYRVRYSMKNIKFILLYIIGFFAYCFHVYIGYHFFTHGIS